MTKQTFLLNEIWVLSFGGAFQRSGIYLKDAKEKDRNIFRQGLRAFIEQKVLNEYKSNYVGEDFHISNIEKICEYSGQFLNVLKAPLPFGVSQKLLNLVLKYYWCLDLIHEPPHFPVDRIIQVKLYGENKHNWTEIQSKEKYLEIVNDARNFVKYKDEDQSISEWELKVFNNK